MTTAGGPPQPGGPPGSKPPNTAPSPGNLELVS